MAGSGSKRMIVTGLFIGIGAAMVALAASGSRATGQRVLYLLSGLLFLTAAFMRSRTARRYTQTGSSGRDTDSRM